MNDYAIKRRIVELARDSSRVIVTDHAKVQMRKRRILLTQVIQVLLRGSVVEPAHKDIYGCWKCTLQLTTAGDRVKVAAALGEDENHNKVVVVTVMH
jgi:Domain of unknown function (DUF4258)